MTPGIIHTTTFTLEKYKRGGFAPYAVEQWEGNSGLNLGLDYLTALLCGGITSPGSYNYAWGPDLYDADHGFAEGYAYIGVGDDDTAASPAQTGLQAAVNTSWQECYEDDGIANPLIDGNTITWYAWWWYEDEAAFEWKEYVLAHHYWDDAINDYNYLALLRGTKSLGFKSGDDAWKLKITVVFS